MPHPQEPTAPVATPPCPRPTAREKLILHWDGSITAGNLITAISMLILVVVWGIRLEGRVNMETLARRNLAQSVSTAVLNLEEQIKAADDSRHQAETDIKRWLERIDARLGAVMLKPPTSTNRP